MRAKRAWIFETTIQTIVSKQLPEIRNFLDVYHAFTHQMSWHQLKLHQQKCRKIPQNHVHLGPSPPQNWCHLTTPVHQGSFNHHFHWPPTPCHSRARYILTVGSVPNLDGCFFPIWGKYTSWFKSFIVHLGKTQVMWNCLVISSSNIPISKEWTQCFFLG